MKASILIIDDSEVARRLVEDTLLENQLFVECLSAPNGTEGLELLRQRPVDLILCDLEMPQMGGFDFLKALTAEKDLRDIPVVLIAGAQGSVAKIKGLEMGASDFVTKPFDPGELVARIKVQLKIKALQDQLKGKNRMLEKLANTDPLTGLCNRRCLIEVIEKEIRRHERTGLPLSLILADIDHFKTINDTYGHQRGDEVLVAVADLFTSHLLRQYDNAARFGGEEFAVVLPASGPSQAARVAERLREAASRLRFDPPLQTLALTLSFGIASLPGDRIGNLDDLIREADEALYRAKRGGRNRVAVARS